jgi:hypothetical protein
MNGRNSLCKKLKKLKKLKKKVLPISSIYIYHAQTSAEASSQLQLLPGLGCLMEGTALSVLGETRKQRSVVKENRKHHRWGDGDKCTAK